MMRFFKFPNATYLASTLFITLKDNLEKSKAMIFGKKTRANLLEQYCLYYIIQILKANFSALTLCQLTLPELIQAEELQKFLAVYKDTVVKSLEQGFTKDFEECPEKAEMEALWE